MYCLHTNIYSQWNVCLHTRRSRFVHCSQHWHSYRVSYQIRCGYNMNNCERFSEDGLGPGGSTHKKDLCLSSGLHETSRDCAITVNGFLPINTPSILERVYKSVCTCFKRDKVKVQCYRGQNNCIKRIARYEKFPLRHNRMCVCIP